MTKSDKIYHAFKNLICYDVFFWKQGEKFF